MSELLKRHDSGIYITQNQIKKEILSLQHIQGQMVGDLYPRIIQGDIDRLTVLLQQRTLANQSEEE